MKPGRELDALVAEKVMKSFIRAGANAMLRDDAWIDINGNVTWDPPPYSESIEAAWLVVEKMKEANGRVSVDWFEDSIGYRWHVYTGEGDEQLVVGAKTAPHAICLAALKAVGVDLANP